MKVEFLGLSGLTERKGHKDFALELKTETDFEQTFLLALLDSSHGQTCSPKASLLYVDGTVSIMIERKDESSET
ncbi:hypothetical protein LCGC14_1305740 [marine sediment metagenome]|uniref:Uncharacterized protein n=1 Tax=marine sediment metagenome TaxID=412755 RepID=A0A0F9L8R1_9ZZZZ